MDDARHAALVRLARSVDVEIAQAGHRRLDRADPRAEPGIEHRFRPAVDVERAFAGAEFAELQTLAVDRRRGSVDQRNALRLAPEEYLLGVGEVGIEHILAVPLGRVGTGTLVEDGGDAAERLAPGDPDAELVAVEIVGDPPAGEIAVLPAVAEIVDDDDVALAAVIEGLDQV